MNLYNPDYYTDKVNCLQAIFLKTKHKKNDWDNIVRINWIKETYKELLSDNGQSSPKQEVLIEKVGARGRIIKILDWVRGK